MLPTARAVHRGVSGPEMKAEAAQAFASACANRAVVAPRPGAPGLFVALAPMDGVTDAVYRACLTDLFGGCSGISLCVSEFVRVTNQRVMPHVFRRHCPELDRGGATPSGVPVFVQLLGGRPGPMANAAAHAVDLGAPGIDLNFGCPAKTVNNHDGGATLLKTPRRVFDVTEAVRRAVAPEIPVTVKIRLGWDSAEPVAEIARAAEDAGAAWLTIHARTRTQLYRPPVDWCAIGRARAAVRMPVVANGDLVSPESIQACARQSGCAAFMIGRGAMGRPELFSELRGPTARLDEQQMAALLLDYLERMEAGGATERHALGRVKQWLRMGAPHRADLARWFEVDKRRQSLPELRGALATRRDLADSDRQGGRVGDEHGVGDARAYGGDRRGPSEVPARARAT